MQWKMFVRTYNSELLSGALGGLLLALSFPPFPMRYCALIALVPVFRYFLLTAGENFDRPVRRAFVLGYTLGITFFLILLYWISILIPASSARMPWLMIPATVLLVLYLSCYTALFTITQSLLLRRFGTSSLFAAPALWSLLELARSRGELGFPWGNLSSALVRIPVAVQGVAVYGPFGLSLIVVLVSVLFAIALFGRSARPRAASFIAALVIVVGHLVWGVTEIARFGNDSGGHGDAVTAAIVQPNVDLAIKWEAAYRDTIFQEIEGLTAAAAASGARLVIFPETAAPISFGHQVSYVRWLKRIARDNDIDLFTGFIDHTREDDEWHPHNAAGLFSGEGDITGYYIKVNLLPFGERMPFSQYIPALGRLDFGQANFKPGTVQTIFRSRGLRFGALICYESIFADYTRRYVRDGADFLVNITNDGWFGSAVGPKQHAEAAILRAVENRVPLLRAANSGISMVVDPVGRVTQSIVLDREGMLTTPVYPKRGLTLFTRYGHAIYFLVVLVNLGAVAVFLIGARAFTKVSVFVAVCTLCLTANLDDPTNEQSKTNFLEETFLLHREINLDMEELTRARGCLGEGGLDGV
jgi:apolipoprotein N-acyltransferase